MASPSFPILGTFCTPRKSGTDATITVQVIPPFTGEGFPDPSKSQKGRGITHITKIIYSTGDTAHTIAVMRPFNYTTFSADAAASQAVVNLTADPGIYSTNWGYSNQFPNAPHVADNAIAGSDWAVYQNADGTWTADKVASVSSLAITMTTSLLTGGVKKGGLFYFFGVLADSDPSTGFVSPQTQIALSTLRDASWSDPVLGIVNSLHGGDPLLFYSPNSTHLGVLEACCGYYAMV